MRNNLLKEENKIQVEPIYEKFIARTMIINGTRIRIKSIFNGNITLEKALSNIVRQKIKQEQ